MRSLIAPTLLLNASLLLGCGAAAPQAQSREVKLTLDGARFQDPAALEAYWAKIREVAASEGLEIKGAAQPFKIQRRSVAFIDTADGALRRAGYALRRRVQYDAGGALKAKAEYTLKRRGAALAEVIAAPLEAEGQAKTKIEEDVIWVEGAAQVVYSRSVKAKTKRRPPMTLMGFAALFPSLSQMALPPQTPLQIVRDRFIEEIKITPGTLRLKNGQRAPLSLSVWRLQGGGATPIIAEISFDHPLDTDAEASRASGLAFLKALYAASEGWRSVGETKTMRVYDAD
ncbi:hypothetical protein KKF91_22010 [Myxococcota bacterium]|nr:hypothetical protein [Myxococcota bacterium]MBU1896335.1 hypothetical protein [Myxococcota bacterium]